MKNTIISGEDFRKVGYELINRADDLQKLTADAPHQIRQMRGYGDLLVYVGNEIDRAADYDIDVTASPGFDIDNIEKSLSYWKVPSPFFIGSTLATVSGTSNAASAVMVEYENKKPEFQLFQNPPESFRSLKVSSHTIEALNRLKASLGDTWRAAWDAIAIGTVESIKSAATNARTVVDEISWLPSTDYLKSLDWCKLDDKGRPTRATRFAWILYGDTLPGDLDSNPSNDPIWKPFKDAYDNLHKYVHTTNIKSTDVLYVETHLKSLQIGLEQYLREGLERLEQGCKKA